MPRPLRPQQSPHARVVMALSVFGVLMFLATDRLIGNSQSRETIPDGFVEVVPEAIRWVPNPRVTGGQTAVLIGDPAKAGPLVLRARMPANTRLMAHLHPEPRTYTVLAGEWRLGFGTEFDASRLRSYPAGSVFRLPARVPHFQATGSTETIIQIESVGPTGTEYVDARKNP
jgi:hypothetical protein